MNPCKLLYMYGVRLLGLVITSLCTDQEVPASILCSALGFFSSGEVFHSMYGLFVSVFQYPLFKFCHGFFGGDSCTLQIIDQGRPSSCVYVLKCGP